MNIIYLNGSPKTKDSNSAYLLKSLGEKISDTHTKIEINSTKTDANAFVTSLLNCDALVIAFPLYVDGIPSHLLRLLEEVQILLKDSECNVKVYTMVNSGFYEAHQNHIALSMMSIWCKKCGLTVGQGIGAGAGEMAQASPIGHGPSANLGRALDTLSSNITAGSTADNLYLVPNFPRFLYKGMAHIGWRSQSKKNNLSPRDLKNYHPSFNKE